MNQHAFNGLRLAATSIAIAGLIVATAGPVAADTTPPGDARYSQTGSSADLYASTCTTDGDITSCTDQQLSAFIGTMRDSATGVTHTNQVCVSVSSYAYSELTGEFVGTPSFEGGCRVDLAAGTIRIDGKLRSASVAPTTVLVEDDACDKFGCEPGTGREIVAGATWAGFGPIDSSKGRDSSGDGTCRTHDSFKGSSRDATVTGTIDGHDLARDPFGSISTGKYTYRSSCTEA